MYNNNMLNGKKIVAFICECNPFHEGHKRLIKSALKEGDIVIAIMSGDFVQRGEVAIYDKYKRCKELLKNGVSLVIELPIEYSLSSAKYFATYSVAVLNELGFVDKLIFGSKINDIEKLSKLSDINLDLENSNAKPYAKLNAFNTNSSNDHEITNDIDKVNIILKYLKEGYSYSYALSKVLGKKLSSNDILAVEYISAIKRLNSKITPICIKRNNDIPTASELRKNIDAKITNDNFSSILNYKLQLAKNSLYDLSNTYLMTNDLYNAILKTADKNLSFTKRAKLLKTKNRTLASIKRVLLNIVIDINKNNIGILKNNANKNVSLDINTYIYTNSDMDMDRDININKKTDSKIKIDYIRILGLKKEFTNYFKHIKIPYLLSYNNTAYKSFVKNFPKSNAIKLNKNGEYKLSPSIILNVFASDLYNLFSNSKNTEATTKTLIF